MADNLQQIKKYVVDILENSQKTRDSDDQLYAEVCKKICKENNYNIINCSFETFMNNRKNFKLPSYASVSRARRKVQSERPDLAGETKKARDAKTVDYSNFALGKA